VCLKEDSFEKIITLWKYNECSKKLIHNFKYKNRFRVADFLFSLFEKKIERINFENSLLIPLPSHKKKMLERGFNPTQIICELISTKVKTNVNLNLVIKKTENVSQASLNYDQRKGNVCGVFEINKDEISKIGKYNKIIVIDDIITTGATMQEVGSILKKALDRDIVVQGVCLFQGSFRKKKNEYSKFLQPNQKKKKEV
jgi:ComF family protein